VIGGSGSDVGTSITTTPDGGFVLTGWTESNNGDFNGLNKGDGNIFVIKLDTRGNVQWKKLLGGSYWDSGNSITSTPDDGFVLTGRLQSNDGDFKGMNTGTGNIFVIKLDSHGDVQWKKVYGGSGNDEGYSITTTPDGGFILTGSLESNDGDFRGMKWNWSDIFVIKLDLRGDVQWKRVFGGSEIDESGSITATPDGGFVLTGMNRYAEWLDATGKRTSYYGDFKGMTIDRGDIFVIKLDSRGDVTWKKLFGGSANEMGVFITATTDSGFVLTGYTESNDGDFKGMAVENGGIFLIKIDSHGDVVWKNTFGGSHWDMGRSITTTPDGGFVLTGSTESDNSDFKGMNKGSRDIFVIKLDSNGNLQPKGKKSKKK
jgi:hypothetical protein